MHACPSRRSSRGICGGSMSFQGARLLTDRASPASPAVNAQDTVADLAAAHFVGVLMRLRSRLAELLLPPRFDSPRDIRWHSAVDPLVEPIWDAGAQGGGGGGGGGGWGPANSLRGGEPSRMSRGQPLAGAIASGLSTSNAGMVALLELFLLG